MAAGGYKENTVAPSWVSPSQLREANLMERAGRTPLPDQATICQTGKWCDPIGIYLR